MAKWFSKNKKLILMILFTLAALLIWRFGTKISVPLFDYNYLTSTDNSNLFGFLDIFTGGALSQFSILALGISPYITASIVVELLQLDIIPQFKEWADEGEEGRAKLSQWTRYIALLLAFVQSVTVIIGVAHSSQTLYFQTQMNVFTYLYMALVMTAGTAFVMWLADQITMHGIGNGGSLIIVAGIVASMPSMFVSLWDQFIAIETRTWWTITQFCIICAMFLIIIIAVVFFEGIQRIIPVQYSNRPGAAQLSGRQDSSIPIKLNSASVIPVIFASTLLSIPLTVLNFLEVAEGSWWYIIFSSEKPIGFVIYILLIFVFSFFYSFLQIDPDKMADNLKKQNAYIPGYKPGEETADFISRVLFKVTLLGATYLAILASLPIIFSWIFNLGSKVTIGGTSIMIVVGVAIETAKQIKQETEAQEYHGFL